MRRVERKDIGARARREADRRLRECLGPPRKRMVEQRASGRCAGSAGEYIAFAMLEPLAIFELAQFVGDAHKHIGIRADPEASAGVEEFTPWKNAVTKAGLSDRAQACDRAGPGERANFLIRRVGRVNEAPTLIDGCVFQQPLYRPQARPGDAIVDLPDLLSGVNMHRP